MMSEHDAILAVGIHRFATLCRQRGQQVTPLAAQKIGAMAKIIGVQTTTTATALGFTADMNWPDDHMWNAMQMVERSGNLALLNQLDTLLMDLTVADVEGDEEPGDRAQLAGAT